MTTLTMQQAERPMNLRLLSTLTAVLNTIRSWHQKRRNLKESRAAFMHMVYLDDQILDDVGVTSEEVRWAASLPLEENAALALREMAKERKSRDRTARGTPTTFDPRHHRHDRRYAAKLTSGLT